MPIMSKIVFSWECPSNIALVKYWGKHGRQLPMNPSVSLTLKNCHTTTKIHCEPASPNQAIAVSFKLGSTENPSFGQKISQFLESIRAELPFLGNYAYNIQSDNSFPHSSGIASSASGMGALALCVCSLAEAEGYVFKSQMDFYQRASYYARLGSGSASRSIYAPWAVWGNTPTTVGSSDLYAVPVSRNVHTVYHNLNDVVLIVDAGVKKVSSRAGHALMNDNRFAKTRYEQAHDNMARVLEALETGDLELFTEVVEEEALTLHALMMTSKPSFILMKPQTLAVLEAVRDFRTATKVPICFTLDAGANVHLLFPESHKAVCMSFIEQELRAFCAQGKFIADVAGQGPQLLR